MLLNIVLVVLALSALWVLSIALRIRALAHQSSNKDADVALVLGAAVWDNEPSPVFRERLKHAIQLYHNKRVRMLVITGGIGKDKTMSEAMVGKHFAIRAGVPENKILIEEESTTTYQNLYYAREQLIMHKALGSILLVTDPLHMVRAKMLAHYLGMNVHPSPRPRTHTHMSTDTTAFWMRETWRYVLFTIGIVFYLPEENPKRF